MVVALWNVQVTISSNNATARLDNWALNWTWQEGEFIYSMQGARPRFADTQVCLNGPAAKSYTPSPGLDINSALSCSVSPEISDLPLSEQNDTTLGNVKYCCRNGTILPAIIDPSKSKSAFTMQVYKVIPYNQDALNVVPPVNFNLVNSSYTCGQPKRIAPSQFPDPYLEYTTVAMKTWQVLIFFPFNSLFTISAGAVHFAEIKLKEFALSVFSPFLRSAIIKQVKQNFIEENHIILSLLRAVTKN